ncbi:MAG TPA: type II secretion system protein [Solirubrobacteraceae bacterium]|nr:type II secretion system protein [Solirubrobacteraceae bacterium]
MSPSRTGRQRAQDGFSLIELLVVILVIGVLAAIAIPVFLNQKGKAVDASGREEARAGAQAAETYSTDHSGNYGGLEPKSLHEYESSLQVEAGNNNSFLSNATSQEGGKGYTVTATTTGGDTFTWAKNSKGEITRTCEVKAGNSKGGCQTGSW